MFRTIIRDAIRILNWDIGLDTPAVILQPVSRDPSGLVARTRCHPMLKAEAILKKIREPLSTAN